jgi:hypothetical protein
MSGPSQFLSRITVPISWDRLGAAPSEAAHAALEGANAGVLDFLLRDVETEATLRTPDERMAEALAPIHAKLDLVVELLGRLRYGEMQLPPAQEIEFSLDRLVWLSPEKLEPQQWLRFSLYFHPTFLEPVLLHGRVHGSAPADEHGCRVEADLIPMPEATNEAIARLAFLTQRRQLAQHRSIAHATHTAR